MSLGRSLTIARANLVRLFRDRLGLFFILVLPLIIVLVTGLQFGGGFEARVGVLAIDGGELADDLAATLERDWQVARYESAETLAGDVEDGRIAFGVSLPDRYTERVLAGEQVEIEYRSAPSDVATARRSIVAAAISEQASLARAATFAASETGLSIEELLPIAEGVGADLPPVEVEVVTVGEALFPPGLAGFTLGAQSQLILFIFLTSLTGAAQLILSRTLGVSRRMLSTSTPMPSILLGEALGRFGVALFQGLFIVAATAIAFGVAWGDPLGAAAVVIAFSLASAGVAMLVGSISTNAEQATSIGIFAGLGIAALGGSMIPPEIFPPVMDTISWFTPHRWALDGFRELIGGAGIADIGRQLGVLMAFAVVLLALATWRLRVALTR
ncbi:MAG TPA: ABC transporter permease [Candidatus Limnocylindria bacterium]